MPPPTYLTEERATIKAGGRDLERVQRDKPEMVAVFGADHIYRMDVQQMVEEHLATGADISVSVVPHPLSEASQLGCLEVAFS